MSGASALDGLLLQELHVWQAATRVPDVEQMPILPNEQPELSNIFVQVLCLRCHPQRFWLKLVAPLNMLALHKRMSVKSKDNFGNHHHMKTFKH
mmetsp:Transcript_2467/g.5683  ORF Transcript_2467/g.5683 Transcript_2467/m.5683 type:complete len:94 (-) Transcript_2467:121-402(-)